MEVQISLLAVVLATVASMLVSTVWYSERVFGAEWGRLAKLRGKAMKIESTKGGFIVFAASFISTYVLAHIIYLAHAFFGNSYMQDSLTTAFWIWFGLISVRMLAHDTFQQRPIKLTVINVLHELVALLVVACIIGLFRP